MSRLLKIILVVLVHQLGTASYLTAHAQVRSERKKFYVGMEVGVGSLTLSQNSTSTGSDSRFAMGFYGGYSPFHWLRTGLNLNGWLIEPFGYFNDPSKGISIGNTYGQIEVFPFKKLNLFLNFEGGISNYTNKHPGKYNARGTGTKLGLGYEYDLTKNVALSLTVNYGIGRFNDVLYPPPAINQHYNALEFLLGITYH